MSPESPSPSNSQSKIAAALFIFILSSILLLYRGKSSGIRGSWSFSYDRYTVVLDCGSTGTRMNVYQWVPAAESRLPVLVNSYPDDSSGIELHSSCEHQFHRLQTRPGSDKFVGNASGVRESIKPLLRLAEKWVPEEFHGETSVFVLGTAVLVLSDVWEVVKESGFFRRRSWMRVLSGEEEGYYSWVAPNFRMGRLRDLSSRIPTLGVVDLGGSSLQVAVEVNESVSWRIEKGLNRLRFGSVHYQVLAYVLPRLGLQDTFKSSISVLMKNEARNESAGRNYVFRHPRLSAEFKQRLALFDGGSRIDILNRTFLRDRDPENAINDVLVNGHLDSQDCIRLARNAAATSNQSLPEIGEHRQELLLMEIEYIIWRRLLRPMEAFMHYQDFSLFITS